MMETWVVADFLLVFDFILNGGTNPHTNSQNMAPIILEALTFHGILDEYVYT